MVSWVDLTETSVAFLRFARGNGREHATAFREIKNPNVGANSDREAV
jgi:hypothetical protein